MSSEVPPGIRSILTSSGEQFWQELTPPQQMVNQARIVQIESWLLEYFPPPQTSPHVIDSRMLGLTRATQLQFDNESCTFIATANVFRCLDGPNQMYTKEILKRRLQQVYPIYDADEIGEEHIRMIVSTGDPFDKFKLSKIPEPLVADRPVPIDMYQFLRKLQDGAVAVLAWPYSPQYSSRRGITYKHARTITGFSSTNEGLYFHFIDPFKGHVEEYSFRDLVIAHNFNWIGVLDGGVEPQNVDYLARSAWILELHQGGIRSVAR